MRHTVEITYYHDQTRGLNQWKAQRVGPVELPDLEQAVGYVLEQIKANDWKINRQFVLDYPSVNGARKKINDRHDPGAAVYSMPVQGREKGATLLVEIWRED